MENSHFRLLTFSLALAVTSIFRYCVIGPFFKTPKVTILVSVQNNFKISSLSSEIYTDVWPKIGGVWFLEVLEF